MTRQMEATGTPGVIANTLRKNGAVRDVRRMAGLESAAGLLGGQAALAAAIGVDARLLRFKISAERPISDADLRLTVAALSARARKTAELAERLAALIQELATHGHDVREGPVTSLAAEAQLCAGMTGDVV